MDKEMIKSIFQKYTMIIVLILVTLFFAWRTGGSILYPQNVSNLISQNAYVFVLTTGMLLCILTGGNVDLSIGSVVCFVGAIGAVVMQNNGMSIPVTIICMIIAGVLIGAWQGYWVAFHRIPPFIVTLAGMFIFRGLSNIVLSGKTISLNSDTSKLFVQIFGGGASCYVPDFFGMEGFNLTAMLIGVALVVIYVGITLVGRINKKKKGYALDSATATYVKLVAISAVILWFTYKFALYKGIPNALIWVSLVVLAYGYMTSNTTVGRYFYAVGGNEKATKLSGINTDKVYFIAYTNMGFLSAVAAMLMIARMSSANPTYGDSYEMDAIGSCFIGGASAYGGAGTVPGVIIGATLMGVINLGMSIMGIDANYQKVVKGAVLLAAVIFDVISKRENSK
ncbi:MAG: multiple monosaccharide ABC transporter permease [Eubacteriales bacterium]